MLQINTNFKSALGKGMLLLPILMITIFVGAQDRPLAEISHSEQVSFKEGKHWLKIKPNVSISVQEFIINYRKELGLGDQDILRLKRSDTDDLGFIHHRYQQFHEGLLVDGAEIIVHERDGRVVSVNGWLVPGLQKPRQQVITPFEALSAALDYIPAKVYLWEDPQAEALIRRIKGDPNASYFPDTELILADPSFSHSPSMYRQVYRVLIHAREPAIRSEVYIDAFSGEVIQELNVLHTQNGDNVQNTNGIALTKYSGPRPIITDSIAPDTFRLAETIRGGGVFTFDLNTGTNELNAVDFYDDDNFWDNVNARQDEAATDAHWGAEMTFDYLLQNHGWEGVDGRGMPLVGYVHYDNAVTNAYWFGTFARFGDGNGMNSTALTSIDVVAHEFTHGVIDFTADLRYQNESGALNESFCDIVGAAVEFMAKPDSADWLMGEDFQFGNYFRNMANPNDKNDPDTYQGEFWFEGTGDNGGVHTNSGVQNFWFYLLTVGGTGTNDLGNDYLVEGLGLDKAGGVMFRNLQYYLTIDSDYYDARLGSLQAAEDIYGACSEEVLEVAKTWYAVGVGPDNTNNDILVKKISSPPAQACGLSDHESVSITIELQGCEPLPAGSVIPLGYQVDNYAIFYDSIIISSDLLVGQQLRHTFRLTTPVFKEPGVHVLKTWSDLDSDGNYTNDTLTLIVDNILEQNSDFALESVNGPRSGCFLANEPVAVRIGFFGCDSLPKGTKLDVFYQIDGRAPASEVFEMPVTLYRGETIDYVFQNLADLGTRGLYNLNTWVDFGPDFLNRNDSIYGYEVLHVVPLPYASKLTFEGDELSLDSFYTEVGSQAEVAIQSNIFNTAHILRMAGGDFWDLWRKGKWYRTDSLNIWDHNEEFGAKSCICVDLSSMDAATLRFDLKQTYSPEYADILHNKTNWYSALRVLVDGTQVGPSFFPKSNAGDLFREREIILDDYTGAAVEICFESRCATNKQNDPENLGDNILIDNIRVGEIITSVFDEGQSDELEFSIYPNPATFHTRIQLVNFKGDKIGVEVFDSKGNEIFTQRIQPVKKIIGDILLETNDWMPGAYIVRLTVDGQVFSRILLILPN